MTGLRLSRALIGLLLLSGAYPVWALSDPSPDSDPPVACQTPLTEFKAPAQEDEAGVTAARMRAACETSQVVTKEMRAAAIASAQAERISNARLLPGGAAPLGTPTWRSIGPTRNNWNNQTGWNGTFWGHSATTNGGRIRTVLQDPSNPERVYVLSAGGGLWRTDNFSNNKPSWQPLSDSAISTSGGAVSFGATSNVLYLGIGDPLGEKPSQFTGFILKSVDGGNTWSAPALLDFASLVSDVKVDTTGGVETVLVATDGGLGRSIDGGVTYTSVGGDPTGQTSTQAFSLLRTSAGWLAITHDVTFNGSSPPPETSNIMRSTDAGATWSIVKSLPSTYRATLASAGPGESTVYALADQFRYGSAQYDVLKSTDGGLTWTALGVNGSKTPTNPNADQPTMDILSGQASYNQMILVDPSDPARNTVYIGGQLSSAVTRNGGSTWTLTSNWQGLFGLPYVHSDFHAAASVLLKGRPALVFGTDGGIFVTSDGGKSFDDTKNEGLVTELIYALTASGKDPQLILAGAQDNGTLLRLPNQTVWNGVLGSDGMGNGWSQANDAASIGSVYYLNFFRAENNPPNAGNKWTRSSTGIGGPDYYPFFTPLTTPSAAADPSGLTFFTVSGLRVWRTQDGARSWQAIGTSSARGVYPNASAGLNCRFNPEMMAMGVSPTNVNQLAVSCLNGRGLVAITTDGGGTWVQQPIRGPGMTFSYAPSSLAWASASKLYASTTTTTLSRTVVKSLDGGRTWLFTHHGGITTDERSGLPLAEVNKLLVDPHDATGDTVYAGTGIGVYRTTDGGANWTRFGANMPMVYVTDLHLSADGKLLRAATYGRGAWEIGL